MLRCTRPPSRNRRSHGQLREAADRMHDSTCRLRLSESRAHSNYVCSNVCFKCHPFMAYSPSKRACLERGLCRQTAGMKCLGTVHLGCVAVQSAGEAAAARDTIPVGIESRSLRPCNVYVRKKTGEKDAAWNNVMPGYGPGLFRPG